MTVQHSGPPPMPHQMMPISHMGMMAPMGMPGMQQMAMMGGMGGTGMGMPGHWSQQTQMNHANPPPQHVQSLPYLPPLLPQSPQGSKAKKPKAAEMEKAIHERERELDGDGELEEAAVVNNFVNYVPRKLTIGRPHPDTLVESHSLGSVEAPDVTYELKLPDKVVRSCLLSAPQLETVVYACQAHNTFLATGERSGFFLGDGAGVGKGRQLSGIIFENYLCGRKKAIWLSASADLWVDARRDLDDIGCKDFPHFCLNKLPYAAIEEEEGLLFCTYSSLVASSSRRGGKAGLSRLQQIIDWIGTDFDGCILFDECHKAKNLNPGKLEASTKSGIAVKSLQERLPRARVVYCSATGVSEPGERFFSTLPLACPSIICLSQPPPPLFPLKPTWAT